MSFLDDDPAWWFHTTLDPNLNMNRRRAWYRRMHRCLCSRCLAVATRLSVNVVLGADRPLSIFERNEVIAWLIDESEVWAIQVGELVALNDALAKGIPTLPVADIWRATGLPRSRLDSYTQDELQDIARGAVLDRIAKRNR
jgi:hypothetical protein